MKEPLKTAQFSLSMRTVLGEMHLPTAWKRNKGSQHSKAQQTQPIHKPIGDIDNENSNKQHQQQQKQQQQQKHRQ